MSEKEETSRFFHFLPSCVILEDSKSSSLIIKTEVDDIDKLIMRPFTGPPKQRM